jgi:transposase
MTGIIDRVEVIMSVQRRRRWSAEEKAWIVQESWAPGTSVSLVERPHGIALNQLFRWRRLYAEGALSPAGAGEKVVPASEYRALQQQARELQRLRGKKTLENEILREARSGAAKKACCARPRRRRTHSVKAIADPVGVSRSNLIAQPIAPRRLGRPPLPDDELMAEIKQEICQQTYGYRRMRALIRRRRQEQGGAAVNVERVHRIMKAHRLLPTATEGPQETPNGLSQER